MATMATMDAATAAYINLVFTRILRPAQPVLVTYDTIRAVVGTRRGVYARKPPRTHRASEKPGYTHKPTGEVFISREAYLKFHGFVTRGILSADSLDMLANAVSQTAWIKSSGIDWYLRAKYARNPHVSVLSSDVIQSMYYLRDVQSKTTPMQTLGVARRVNQFVLAANASKPCFLPVNVDGNHWLLLVVVPALKYMVICDSLMSSASAEDYRDIFAHVFHIMHTYCDNIIKATIDIFGWKYSAIDCTRQNDGYNCSMFVLSFIEKIIHDKLYLTRIASLYLDVGTSMKAVRADMAARMFPYYEQLESAALQNGSQSDGIEILD